MAEHVCPWWVGYLIDNPLRRLLHHPEKILGPYVEPGMTALDVGCGMGVFSIAMARMVGPTGRVFAVDLQQRMLDTVRRRAVKAGLSERIQTHRCESNDLNLSLTAQVDFALAFAMVHEVPDARRLLAQVHECLKPGGRFLIAEPRSHVLADTFQKMLDAGEEIGFRQHEEPAVRRCRTVVLVKAEDEPLK